MTTKTNRIGNYQGGIFKGPIDLAKEEIAHTSDGPVTEFVAISRALEMTASGNWGVSTVANALDSVLMNIRDNGSIIPNSIS